MAYSLTVRSNKSKWPGLGLDATLWLRLPVVVSHLETCSLVAALDIEAFIGFGAVQDCLYT